MRLKISVLAGLAAALFSGQASASQLDFTFTSNDNLYTMTASVFASDTPDSAVNTAQGGTETQGFAITGITGFITGPSLGGGITAITSLIPNPNGPSGSTNNFGFIYDNNAFATDPRFNLWGVLFDTTGNSIWNLWSNGPQSPNSPIFDYELYTYNTGPQGNGQGVDEHGTLAVSSVIGFQPAVPEASTWMMLLMGFAGVGFAAYRKRPRSGAALRLA
jgi:hypothetical protein